MIGWCWPGRPRRSRTCGPPPPGELAALGLELGHIDQGTVGLVTLVGIITIGLSTYLIIYSHPIYERLAPLLSVFERAHPTRGEEVARPAQVDVIVFGYGRFGRTLVRHLVDHGLQVLVVDWDPQAVVAGEGRPGLEITFGDAENAEFPASLPLREARAVVSALPRPQTNRALMDAVRRQGFDGVLAATSHHEDDALGDGPVAPDLVLRPFSDAGEHGAQQIIASLEVHEVDGAATPMPADGDRQV